MSPGLRPPTTISSKFRQHLPNRVPPRLVNLMSRHSHEIHGLTFVRFFDTEKLLKHAEQADPSKIVRHPEKPGWIESNSQFFETNQIRQAGRQDVLHWRFLPVSKKGSTVLYKVWGSSGRTNNHVEVREPEKTNQFFVVDPKKGTIEYYNGNVKEPFMEELFGKTEPKKFHDAFWAHFNKGRRTPKENLVMSADFDAHTGVAKHIRSQSLSNSSLAGSRESGLYLIHNESAIPSSGIKSRSEPHISHEKARLKRVGHIETGKE